MMSVCLRRALAAVKRCRLDVGPRTAPTRTQPEVSQVNCTPLNHREPDAMLVFLSKKASDNELLAIST